MKIVTRFLTIVGVAALLSILLSVGWAKWLATTPQPLSQDVTLAAAKNNRLTQGSYYEISIPPEQGDWYTSADYRLWVPKNVQVLRGVMVMQHGCGDEAAATGLNHATDLQWQALAAKHQFAILGSQVSVGKQPCEFWVFPRTGLETAFLKALNLLGQNSGHPELATVPWVLRGHSGGAEWIAHIITKYPDRTIAGVAMRGGGYFLIGSEPSALKVPILFAVGADDPNEYDCVELPSQIFSRQRQQGAIWTFTSAPNTAHEAGSTRSFAIPYLDEIITQRLDSKTGKLLPIESQIGWLGHLVTHEIAVAKAYTGNPSEAVWLPNEQLARKWQEYISEGMVSPTHKPAIPTDVRVTRNAADTLITWNFQPDLENGLPSFRIYRNSSLLVTLQGQGHNFGDAAEPAIPILEFHDKQPKSNSVYSVVAFNALGESIARSAQLEESR